MKFSRSEITDIIIIEPNVFKDERGYFFESFKQNELNEFLGYDVNFCQDNVSKSNYGVLRGLHYQEPPFAQAKLVRVIQGSVLDVVVDIRKGSPNYGKYVTAIISAENWNMIWVPKGFAHGFLTLETNTVVFYKVSQFYSKDDDRGFIWDDPQVNIDWPADPQNIILSEKDSNLPRLKDLPDYFSY